MTSTDVGTFQSGPIFSQAFVMKSIFVVMIASLAIGAAISSNAQAIGNCHYGFGNQPKLAMSE